jgi:hypothetical protein
MWHVGGLQKPSGLQKPEQHSAESVQDTWLAVQPPASTVHMPVMHEAPPQHGTDVQDWVGSAQHELLLQLWPEPQLPQLLEPPQAFMMVPHELTGQLGVGHSHWLEPLQTSPGEPEQLPQSVEPPQEFVMVPHELAGQLGVGQTQELPTQFAPFEQLGQVVWLPQEFVIVPHPLAPQLGVGHTQELPTQFSPFVQFGQLVEAPQEFVIVPHAPPGQLGVGQVHVVPLQLSPLGHVGEHPIVPPQPFEALLQWPEHAFGSGVQHWPASPQIPPPAQLTVPPVPQFTVKPHVSVAVPQDLPEHALPVGTQASAPHVPQLMDLPQLSVPEPHRPLLHHVGSVVQSHWLVDASQKIPFPEPQMFPQMVLSPQLFGPVPQWSTHQDRMGEHASASAASWASATSFPGASLASVASLAASSEATSPPPSAESSPGASAATSSCVVWSTGAVTS